MAKTHYIVSEVNYITPSFNISAGDTIIFQAGQKDYIALEQLHGTKDYPITVLNYGKVIIDTDHYYGIRIQNCSYIHFSGTGDEQVKYGFNVKRVKNGAGLSIDGFSTHIEINNIEIHNTLLSGIIAKYDPNNDLSNTRDKYLMRGLNIHDNFISNTGREGLYIGHSKFGGYYSEKHGEFIFPHLLRDILIYDNIIEYTDWDALQVSSSDSAVIIRNNVISYDSQDKSPNQMSGILIGGGTSAEVYSNSISYGFGDGINVFGQGLINIYNNLIVEPGLAYDSNTQKHGIYLRNIFIDESSQIQLYHNSIIRPKNFGIVFKFNTGFDHRIINNLIVAPGYNYDNTPNFLDIVVKNRPQIAGNLFEENMDAIHFINPSAGNFKLNRTSIAIDYGISFPLLDADIDGKFRPSNNKPDAGAYEFQGVPIKIQTGTEILQNITILGRNENDIRLSIPDKLTSIFTDVLTYSMLGKRISCSMQLQERFEDKTIIGIKFPNSGMYIVKSRSYYIKIIIP